MQIDGVDSSANDSRQDGVEDKNFERLNDEDVLGDSQDKAEEPSLSVLAAALGRVSAPRLCETTESGTSVCCLKSLACFTIKKVI